MTNSSNPSNFTYQIKLPINARFYLSIPGEGKNEECSERKEMVDIAPAKSTLISD